MKGYLDQFLKQHTLLKSSKTLQAYQRDLASLTQFLIELSEDFTEEDKQTLQTANFYQVWAVCNRFDAWRGVTIEDIQDYVGMRMRDKISPRTISRQLSAFRSFFDFLIAEQVMAFNPAKTVKAPKQGKPLPKSLDVDWTQQLLDQPVEKWQDVRDQAIFELLYSSGLRVSECAQLNLKKLLETFENGWLVVKGKGGKERQVPIGSKAQFALQAWLNKRADHANAEEPALFVNRFGKRLGVNSIQKSLDKRAQQAGLPTKMSPHRLRHAFATHMLESSGDLRAVQEMLGHANLTTTQVYTKLDMQHLAQVYDQAHPRAKKRNETKT